MFVRILSLLVIVCLLVGCGKQTKSTTPDVAVKPKAAPRATPDAKEKSEGADRRSWLNDPRYRRPGQDDEQPDPIGVSGKPIGGGLTAPKGGWTAGELGGSPVSGAPTTTPAPTTGTGTIAPSQPASGGKTVTKADLEAIWTFIQYASGPGGQMPTRDQVYDALFKSRPLPAAAELVRGGQIVITGATLRESIWAYEATAPSSGGWVASQNGVENLTAAQLAQRLR